MARPKAKLSIRRRSGGNSKLNFQGEFRNPVILLDYITCILLFTYIITKGLRPPDPQTPTEGKRGEKQYRSLL